jgi:hypothetical protein
MKKFQAVVIMIALVMLVSGRRFRWAVVAGTGRAIEEALVARLSVAGPTVSSLRPVTHISL